MSDDKGSGGANGDSGGVGDKGDSVSYETHRKLLSEKKAAAEKLAQAEARLAELEAKERERETADLEKLKDYDKIKANLQDEIKKRDEKLAALDAERQTALKLDSFFSSLDGKLDRKFWGLIDLDQIAVDPATKQVDQMSVTKYLETFRKEFPEVIVKPGKSSMPDEKPNGAAGTPLTLDQWKALPLKEKKERMKDVKLQ